MTIPQTRNQTHPDNERQRRGEERQETKEVTECNRKCEKPGSTSNIKQPTTCKQTNLGTKSQRRIQNNTSPPCASAQEAPRRRGVGLQAVAGMQPAPNGGIRPASGYGCGETVVTTPALIVMMATAKTSSAGPRGGTLRAHLELSSRSP